MNRLAKKFIIFPSMGLLFYVACSTSMTRADEPLLKNAAAEKNAVVGEETGFTTAWQTLNAVVENVMKEHLSPPSRQQMYLDACRGMLMSSKTSPPGDLSETFSALMTSEDFQRELLKIWNFQIEKGIAPKTLTDAAITSLLFGCVQPQTVSSGAFVPRPVFVSENENRIRKQIVENQYVGIGIRVGIKDGIPQIHEPFYGGAAQKAGARKGDLIVAVEGVPSKDRNFRDIIDHLRGEEGSTLNVTLRHESETEERQYKMVRAVVPIDSVRGQKRNADGSWALSLPGSPDIAYLKITSIVGSTAAELIDLGRKIDKAKFRGVILDFTEVNGMNVPDLHHAIMVADALMGENYIGDISTRDNKTKITTQSDHVLKETPIVVLAPPRASGPEFLVFSSLANHGRAKIVGTPLVSRGFCTKTVELPGIGAIDQLTYAVALPNLVDSGKTETTHHDENTFEQLNPNQTLVPDVVVRNQSTESYLKAALELLNQ